MPDAPRPRSFFLNEQHELTRGEKDGGGGIPHYAAIDWQSKGQRIRTTLTDVKQRIDALPDPAKDHHYFLLAKPDRTLRKITRAGDETPREVDEPTEYSGKDSRVFSRLGMDLLGVSADGSAMVHATPDRFEQLGATAASLPEFGIKEQVRWARIDSFDLIPLALRIDNEWVRQLRQNSPTDAVIELQPLLTRVEVDQVMRAIAELIQVNAPRGQLLTGTGTDFSGRQWLRGSLSPEALLRIAGTYISVQSLHSPLVSEVAAAGESGTRTSTQVIGSFANVENLPSVAVVDTGIPQDHAVLRPFRRGIYTTPLNAGGTGGHGSFVASRIVFGEQTVVPQQQPTPSLRYFDVNVAFGPRQIDHKELLPALEAVVRTAPDVRVFNLSFDGDPLVTLQPVKRQEELILAQDLDNFIFQYDVLVVVAAGNSPPGIIPNSPYPDHHVDPNWQLGAFAQTFNTLTCGSYVSQLSASGLVRQIGWPSPFCRTGPGLADTPKPDLSAPGGNSNSSYRFEPGIGVLGLDEYGSWREGIGTSYAAPLLARESALAMRALDDVCEPGARPYASTVRAFLALTAIPPSSDPPISALVKKTLGYGTASADRLRRPVWENAVLIWQGTLEDKSDLARVQIPIPREWLLQASAPRLSLFVAADLPVNAAVSNVWASRNIVARLRTSLEERAVYTRGTGTSQYSLVRKEFDLSRVDPSNLETDLWILELSYDEAADYLPSMTFPSQQRLAFAAELRDDDNEAESPQSYLQAMTLTQTMTRLSVPPAVARTPIVLRLQT